MSLRDKYTDEEWAAIPPFTGFHHNKVKEELLEKAAQAIKNRWDNLIFTTTTKESYKGISENDNPHLLDEMVVGGFPAYEAAKKPITNDDEVNQFGKVNIWDFSGGMNRDTDLEKLPDQDYKFAENISVEQMLAERIKKENTIQMNIEKKKIITQQIIDKVRIEKQKGRKPRVILMSVNDYNIFHDPNNNQYKYYLEDESSKNNKSGVFHSGFSMITHKCMTVEDGKVEIY